MDIDIYLNSASQEVAIKIHDAVMRNSWFGLYNKRRRLFFDVKNMLIYQITDLRKHSSKPDLKLVECQDREHFFLLIKFTLISCKQIMTDLEALSTLAQIKILLSDDKEIRNQITGRSSQTE